MNESNKRSRLGWILIIIGTVFLARNLDLFEFSVPYYLTSWQSILILVGFVLFVSNKNKSTGAILITIGGFFLIYEIYNFDIRTYWPLILVVIGVSFLLGRGNFKKRDRQVATNYIDEIAVLGGGDRVITSDNFQGGKLTIIFGGLELDLRQAKLAEGNYDLDIFTLFGGVNIRVPNDFPLKVSVVSILGGFSDERSVSQGSQDSSNHLEIKGFTMFGGGSIKT